MRRIAYPVKSQEELKSDIFCLKRQLALTLDENQLLKVKIRRFENELRRKDRYVECLKTDPQKDRKVVSRFAYESGATMIDKLRKRNEELEDLLLKERDLQNVKRYNGIKRAMCVYSSCSHGTDCHQKQQASKRAGSKSSSQNIVLLNSRPISKSSSRRSLGEINTTSAEKPTVRMRSSGSLLNANSSVIVTKNPGFSSVTGDADCRNTKAKLIKTKNHEDQVVVNESPMLKIITEKRLIRMKNAEIFRLSAELRAMKNLLRMEKCDRDSSLVCTNFIEENRRNVSHCARIGCYPAPNRRTLSRCIDKTIIRCSTNDGYTAEKKKLPTVDEQNEKSNADDESPFRNRNNKVQASSTTRPKTRIEYVYDSEVSSDGEEYCLPGNLRNFLQRAVNTMSSGNGTDVNSD